MRSVVYPRENANAYGYVASYRRSEGETTQSIPRMGEDVEYQIGLINRFVGAENFTFCGITKDIGIDRGRNAKRIGLAELLNTVRDGDYLVVTSLATTVFILDVITSKNIQLICLKEGIDTSTAHGRYIITILTAYSHLQEELEARVTINEEEKVKLKELLGEKRFGRLQHLLDYPSPDPPSDEN